MEGILSINHNDFNQTFEQNNKGVVVYYFTGTDDEQGNNWCSDCVAAKPFIKKVIHPLCQKKGVKFIETKCGNRDQWKDKSHPLRIHKNFQLTGIPTLCYTQDGVVLRKLVEEQLTKEALLEQFLDEE